MDKPNMDGSHFTIFYSYAHEDEALRDKLETHLSLLKQQKYINSWHDRLIPLGELPAQQVIDEQLKTAHIILLLISPDFLASDYRCLEMQKALTRHRNGEAYVIPVLLRPVDLRGAPFEDLQCLPRDGRPIKAWKDIDEAFRDVATGIRMVVERLQDALDTRPLPPLPAWQLVRRESVQEEDNTTSYYSGKYNIIKNDGPIQNQVIGDYASVNVYINNEQRLNFKKRGKILDRVIRVWNHVQEKAWINGITLELELQEDPNLVIDPVSFSMQEAKGPARVFPFGSITNVYDEMDQRLLILGGPGSGKTSLLLMLLRYLSSRAQKDPFHPIPVIFSLSSWTPQQSDLNKWFVEELDKTYNISPKDGKMLVKDQQILPLLDNLDGVPQETRIACIDAINTYRQNNGLTPTVICCRTADYRDVIDKSQRKLWLKSAIVIQRPTKQQIDEYLSQVSGQFVELKKAIENDLELLELAKIPLMLSIMARVYNNLPVNNLPEGGSSELYQKIIFERYVDYMLEYHRSAGDKRKEYIISWLVWLAKQMAIRNQEEFYIERMQPDWLPETQQYHPNLAVTLLFKLIVIVGAGIEGMRSFESYGGLAYALVGGLVYALIGAYLAKSELVEGAIVPAEVIQWPWKNMEYVRFINSLFSGLAIGLRAVLFIFVLSFLSVSLFLARDIGSLFGVGILLTAALVLIVGSAILLFLQNGWSSRIIDDRKGMIPNQGIWLSGRNSIIAGLIFGLISGLTFAFTLGLQDGVVCGLMIGLVMGLFNGGVACIKHIILRYQLARAGSIPWNYRSFLDYTAEHILLYKRGNGYIFIHKLLLEYFADCNRQ